MRFKCFGDVETKIERARSWRRKFALLPVSLKAPEIVPIIYSDEMEAKLRADPTYKPFTKIEYVATNECAWLETVEVQYPHARSFEKHVFYGKPVYRAIGTGIDLPAVDGVTTPKHRTV